MSNKKLVQEGWEAFAQDVLPEDASVEQVRDMNISFFCGAYCVWNSMMRSLSSGEEPTEEDMALMDSIQEEMDLFEGVVQVAAIIAEGGKTS